MAVLLGRWGVDIENRVVILPGLLRRLGYACELRIGLRRSGVKGFIFWASGRRGAKLAFSYDSCGSCGY